MPVKGVNTAQRLEALMNDHKVIQAAGAAKTPLAGMLLSAAAAPSARLAAKGHGWIEKLYLGSAMLNQLARPHMPPLPKVPKERAIYMGTVLDAPLRGQHFFADMNWFTRHHVDLGPTGSGKTVSLLSKIAQLCKKNIGISFQDHKSDGRRVLAGCRNAIILPINRIRENFLSPIGDPRLYFTGLWSDFRHYFSLRASTSQKLTQISLNIEAGRKPGQPSASFSDNREIVKHHAVVDKDDTLHTAVSAMDSCISVMGRAADVRAGIRVDQAYQIVCTELMGEAPETNGLLSSIQYRRFQARSISEGIEDESLRQCYYTDELVFEYGSDYASNAHLAASSRRVSQVRYMGQAVIGGASGASVLEPSFITNIGSCECFAAQGDANERLTAMILNLPDERRRELRQPRFRVALYKTFAYPECLTLLIPEFNLPQRHMSDAELARWMQPAWDNLDAQTVFSEHRGDRVTPISYTDILGETSAKQEKPAEDKTPVDDIEFLSEHIELLKDIQRNPSIGIASRFKNCKWSPTKGQKILDALIAAGMVTEQTFKDPTAAGRPRRTITISDRGKEILNELADS